MKAPAAPPPREVASFRRRLLLAMMLVVGAAAVALLLFTQRNMAASARLELEREFQTSLAALHAAQQVRHASLAERSRALARRSRIHAALEDGAPDLLYPSARDELADLAGPEEGAPREAAPPGLRARYYRFLDAKGQVIPAPNRRDAGDLAPAEEARLSLSVLPGRPQTGYLLRDDGAGDPAVDELILTPIVSTETGETIAAIVLGFPVPPARVGGDAALAGGVMLDGVLYLPTLAAVPRADLQRELKPRIAAAGDRGRFEFDAPGGPYLVFFQQLNPGSAYPAAFEVAVDSLAASVGRQHRLAWEFCGVGILVLAGGFLASQTLARRLAVPVERLAVDSEANRAHWHRAEAALETTSRELQRSARFSADASHQLKTPVTVLRAGLEGLLAGQELGPEAREEVAGLVHQTFRLASVIEDLLLLSRLDAGRLQIQFSRLDLAPVLAALVDDLGALPDHFDLEVLTDLPPTLWVTGERGYLTLVLENLLENARKYNHPHGRVAVAAFEEGEWAVVGIGNTGPAIPAEAGEHIFERFHRGAVGENVPGHGIGLNLARELARLHGGDVRLVRSGPDWTDFELRLRRAPAGEPPAP